MRRKTPLPPLRYRQHNKKRIKEEIGTLRLVLVAAIGIDATLIGQLFKAFGARNDAIERYASVWQFISVWFLSFETLIVLAA